MTPLAAALVLALAPAQPPAAVPLAWKLDKGDKFYVETNTKLDQTITLPGGQKQKQNQNQTTFHRYRVVEKTGEKLVLEQTILRSETAGNLAPDDAAKRLKGVTMTYTLDPSFRVTDVQGYDKFLDAASGDDATARKALAAMLPEEVLKTAVEDLFGSVPGKAVKAGESWTRKTRLPMGPIGDFQVKATYKYTGSADADEKITLAADMTYSAPKGGGAGLPFQITKGELKADQFTGTVHFDAKAGRVRTAEAATKVNGKLTFRAAGNDVEVEIKQDMTITSKVTDKNPVVD
jgi:hypothetical protein